VAVVIDEVVGEVDRSTPDGPQRPQQTPRQEPTDLPAFRIVLARVMRRHARTEAD